jgi:hypothetical protein
MLHQRLAVERQQLLGPVRAEPGARAATENNRHGPLNRRNPCHMPDFTGVRSLINRPSPGTLGNRDRGVNTGYDAGR